MKYIKVLTIAIIGMVLLNQCSEKKKLSNPLSFKDVITLYSSLNQSSRSPVIVQFVQDSVGTGGEKVDADVFQITPSVEGELTWETNNRLKFTPAYRFSSDQIYNVDVNLDELFTDLPDSLKTFSFQFNTIKQNFKIGGTYVSPVQDSWFKVSGSIETSDFMEDDELHCLVSAQLGKENASIKWLKNYDKSKVFFFELDNIKRKEDAQELTIHLNANPNYNVELSKKITIPALGDFRLVRTEIINEKTQQVKLIFSDFIDPDQSIEGMIHVSKGKNEMIIQDNYALIDFSEYISDSVYVTIEAGLRNTKRHKLQKTQSQTIYFDPILPGVKLIDENTILPYGNTLPFSFEAVNLTAVDIKITKIRHKNILPFLQDNDLDGQYRIRYVGEPILTKRIALDTNQNLNFWNQQTIDLKPLIQKDPSALYHVEVGFRRSYSLYPCDQLENENYDPSTIGVSKDEKITEENFWIHHDAYSSYDWNERENPCHSMFYEPDYYYYGEHKTISTNILGSNLGVIAKEEKNGDILVAVTSITSTHPRANIKVDLFNLQNRKLRTAYTNDQGIARLNNIDGDPFLVIASSSSQRGYLKLRSGESLSLSQFDVGGTSNKQDIKGFLYAERGVWRPGDSIFINLIIEDKFKNLPKNYPIGFEFTNPNGQIVERRTTTKGLNGHYKFWTKTDVNDITGDYYVTAYVGNNTYSKTIKVETIRPNRLKINMQIGEGKAIYSDSTVLTEINTKWLHGAPGKNLQHKVDVVLTSQHTSFKNYDSYTFQAPYREFEASEYTFLDEITDEKGHLSKTQKMENIRYAPGFLKANFKIKAFEKGGRFSIDEMSKTFYPYSSYVGVKGDDNSYYQSFNTPIKHEIVNLNTKGEVENDSLIVQLYHLGYNWWYDVDDNQNYIRQGSMNKRPVKKDTLYTVNGKVNYDVLLGDGYEEGRYLLTVKNSQGHMTGKMLYVYEDSYGATSSTVSGTKKLELTTDKENYKKGEWIELSIPTAKAGKVFLSLENGQEILQTKWINVSKEVTTYRFLVKDNMAPYVYANVIYIQPHQHKENDLPLRMYGVIPIKVESQNTHLNPVILVKDELRPKQPYTVKIKEENGLPMTYTLAIVDEGLLDITRYRTPNIWKAFNHKPALEVKTWDVFDQIIKAQKFNVKNLLSIGGDGGEYEEAPEGIKLNRFKPVVKFVGPFYCAPGQTKTHQFTMPNYVGSVRMMVVAGHNQAYGKAKKNVSVKSPLMVLGTLPRVLGANEEIHLPVDVFAMKENIKNVSVEVQSNDLVELVGETKKDISFNSIGDQQVYFKLKTKEKFGVANIKIVAKSGKEVAHYDVELEVRPSNSNRTISSSYTLAPGVTFDQNFTSYGYEGTNNLTVEVSSIPPINLKKRLDYLIHYPYGCVEQTTSSVFPQLYLTQLMDVSPKRKRKIEKNIKAGIQRLKRFQTHDGGFSYWPGGYKSHEWATNYAGHFLIEAQQKGFEVDQNILLKWSNHQSKVATEWQKGYYSNTLAQAYRLYLLAKSDNANVGAMNRLKSNLDNNDLATWYLAAAYALIGQTSVADQLLKKAPATSSSAGDQIESFGSNHRDNAIILLMLSELNKKDRAFKLAKSIAEQLNKNQYMSTQTTAYCLLAVSKFSGMNGGSTPMKFDVKIAKNQKIESEKSIWQKTSDYEGSQPISVTNTSDQTLFLTVVQNGIPRASQDTINEALGLRMDVKYEDMDGNKINPKKLHQGEDFVAVVNVKNISNKHQHHVSLTQIFPSGWEIHNTRMNETSTWTNKVNYEDVRDDRVNLFYNINSNGHKTFKVFLNASYLGKYYLPAVQTEAMYDHDIRARKHGNWVEIIED